MVYIDGEHAVDTNYFKALGVDVETMMIAQPSCGVREPYAANRMLGKSSNCRRRKLGVRCYAVTPIDQECGVIEWVPNMLQLRSIIKDKWDEHRTPLDNGRIRNKHTKVMELMGQRRVEGLCELVQGLMQEPRRRRTTGA